MPKPSLEGIDLKLARASEHLLFLQAERSAYLERAAGLVVGHFDPERGDYIFRVAGDPPPLAWGIAASEFAHMLRSVLDNTLRQLILQRGMSAPTPAIQFPIHEDRAAFLDNVKRETKGVSAPDSAFIEKVQPFHIGPHPWTGQPLTQWHPLAMLTHLNNLDQHGFTHASACMTQVVAGKAETRAFLVTAMDRVRVGPQSEGITAFGMPLLFLYADGSVVESEDTIFAGNPDDRTEIVRVIGPDRPGTEMKIAVSPAFDVSFSDWERPMDIVDLTEIRDKVVEIVEHFRPMFGE